MPDEVQTLSFGVTFDMAASQVACGQHLSLTSHFPCGQCPPHRHVNNYLCMVLDGSFAETQQNICRDRNAGTFFIHEAGETHFDQIGSGGAVCLNLHFAPDDMIQCKGDGQLSTPGVLTASQLAFELVSQSEDELVMASLAAEIVAEIQRERADAGNWVSDVVHAIADEPKRRWRLEELAELVSRHPVHVAQSFRMRTGLSVGAFQRLRRLTSLSLALRRKDKPLATLAADFGYYDQAHMNAEFRRAFGVSPGRYRRDFH